MKDKMVYYKIYSICGLNNSNQKDSEKINFILNNIRDYVSVSESEEEIENFIKECIKNIDFSKYNFEKDFVEKYSVTNYLQKANIKTSFTTNQIFDIKIREDAAPRFSKKTFGNSSDRKEYIYEIPLCFNLKVSHSIKEEINVDGKTFHRFDTKTHDLVTDWQNKCKSKSNFIEEDVYHKISFCVERKEMKTDLREFLNKISSKEISETKKLSATERFYLELE